MVDNSRLLNALKSLTVDTSSLSVDDIDADTVDFYESRIRLCLSDDCPDAANAYLTKLQKDKSINATTKLEILNVFRKAQEEL